MHHLYYRKRAKNKYCFRTKDTPGEIRSRKSQEDRQKTRTIRKRTWRQTMADRNANTINIEWNEPHIKPRLNSNATVEYADHVPLVTFVVTIYIRHDHPLIWNCIGGIMASVFASSAIDRGFEPRSCQSKKYKIGICCFSHYKVKKFWIDQFWC